MYKIIPITDLRNTTEISKLCNKEDKPVFITKNGYGDYYVNCVDQTTANHVKWNYTAPQDGEYFMYADIANGDDVTVMQNDVAQTKKYGMGRSYIAAIGHFSKGDKISVYADLEAGKSGSAKVYVNRLKTDIFEQGLEKISKDVMTIETDKGVKTVEQQTIRATLLRATSLSAKRVCSTPPSPTRRAGQPLLTAKKPRSHPSAAHCLRSPCSPASTLSSLYTIPRASGSVWL